MSKLSQGYFERRPYANSRGEIVVNSQTIMGEFGIDPEELEWIIKPHLKKLTPEDRRKHFKRHRETDSRHEWLEFSYFLFSECFGDLGFKDDLQPHIIDGAPESYGKILDQFFKAKSRLSKESKKVLFIRTTLK